ncbi:MAG TPA: hypothetical protein VNI84_01355 [Pyrinomonadaceae bacterium]|nr:hypothetical protein [Pyrinomonadaceae bacterium]
MSYQPLHSIYFQGTLEASAPKFSAASVAGLSEGSFNAIVSGSGFTRAFGGMTAQAANSGSRKMIPVGRTWGGIKDRTGVAASGSFLEDIGKSRWGIGAGQPHVEGADIGGFVLSTNLQVSVKTSGVYGAPVEAGLGQPSAPEIGIVATIGDVSNSISAKIERRRPSTGARSLASPTSAVIAPQSNRVRLTFPLAAGGQTHWRAYFTFHGFGGQGIHYLAKFGSDLDIPESVVAAGTSGGIARSLEFNFKDGDLVPLEASYDDYTPPAATHAIRLESVMNLVGCYADSAASPTSGNTGTAIAVSKINNYESYVPTHLLYLPEQVTDSLARPIADYGYIACESSIHAIQYVGYRGDDLPPCTITTILPDIGVQYPHNWTHFRGRLLIYTAEGNLLLMKETGEFEGNFAAPVVKIIQNWTTADTIVGYDPKNDLIIVANGKTILVYSLVANVWRQIWLPDYGISGSVLACTTSRRRLYISVSNGASSVAYSFDTANASAPLSFASNYQNAPSGNAVLKDLFEMALSAETGENDTQLAVCINSNLQKTVFRRISAAAGSANITDAENKFYPGMVGKKAIIFADGIAGAGSVLIEAKISGFTDSGTLTLTTLAGAPLNPQIAKSDLLMYVGDFTETRGIAAQSLHFPNFFPNMPECRSYCVAVWLKGAGDMGNVLTCEIFGSQYASSRAR